MTGVEGTEGMPLKPALSASSAAASAAAGAGAGAALGATLVSPAAHRSRFYLGSDINALRDRVLRAGFRNAVLWYQPVVMDLLDGEDYSDR